MSAQETASLQNRCTKRNLPVARETRGYNIGVRLIEDFLARTGLGRCKDFAEVGEVMSKVETVSFSNSIRTRFAHLIPFPKTLGRVPITLVNNSNVNPSSCLTKSTSTGVLTHIR